MKEEIKQKSNLTLSVLNTQVCSLYTCVISILIGSTCEKGEVVHREQLGWEQKIMFRREKVQER